MSSKGKYFNDRTDALFAEIASPAHGKRRTEQIYKKVKTLASVPPSLAKDLASHYRNSRAFKYERETARKYMKRKRTSKGGRRRQRRITHKRKYYH